MSKTVTINGVVLTEEQIREAVAKLDAPEPKRNRWEFNDGDRYYHIWGDGDVVSFTWTGDGIDRARLTFGSVFHTRKEAEQAVEQQKALVRMLRWADENAPFTPDWSNGQQEKWLAVYRHGLGFYASYRGIVNHFTQLPCFATQADAERFIAACEDDLRIYGGLK